MKVIDLQTINKKSVQYLKGVGPAKAAILGSLGIFTLNDLIQYYPRRYEDRSLMKSVNSLTEGEVETFQGVILNMAESRPRRGLHILKIAVGDDSGIANLVWFNQPHQKKIYKPGSRVLISGKIKRTFQVEVHNPVVESVETAQDSANIGRIVPIYIVGDALSQTFFRDLIKQVLCEKNDLAEILPLKVVEDYNLMKREKAILNIHFPENWDALNSARKRLAFEELYLLQCGLMLQRKQKIHNQPGIKHGQDGQLSKNVLRALPFSLTQDQEKALVDIKFDMEDIYPMQRLVQGDVGSGKTVIAALALVKTVENGYQGAMMAPTEILAEQHYASLCKMFKEFPINVELLTGSLPRSQKEKVLAQISSGNADIIVGTHALIQDGVNFQQLGLVITDEQHRFGVTQRAKLQEKGEMPDMLVMTATPIPRTMALTIYGDLDVSVIRQLPPGRKPVRTYIRSSERRHLVYKFIIDEISKGRQAYVVCPLVEESEKIEAQSATQLYEEFTGTWFKTISCGLIHGKMKSEEKDAVMQDFYNGKIKILIATTVIEVGVNVPNASIMVVENAERFGLAQLHQLRGRIGRGEHLSHCILMSDKNSKESKERLRIMAETSDGFVLAEEDLKLRGPGQFFGFRQHGMPDLKVADIVNDIDILIQARSAAETTVFKEPFLSFIQNYMNLNIKSLVNN